MFIHAINANGLNTVRAASLECLVKACNSSEQFGTYYVIDADLGTETKVTVSPQGLAFREYRPLTPVGRFAANVNTGYCDTAYLARHW